MLPISTSRPPRRRLLSAASVALGSCAPPTMSKSHLRASPCSGAKSLGVGFDVSRKRDGRDAGTAELRERVERQPVPPSRDDTARAQRKREKHGRASIRARRAGDDDRFACRETTAQQGLRKAPRIAAERKAQLR